MYMFSRLCEALRICWTCYWWWSKYFHHFDMLDKFIIIRHIWLKNWMSGSIIYLYSLIVTETASSSQQWLNGLQWNDVSRQFIAEIKMRIAVIFLERGFVSKQSQIVLSYLQSYSYYHQIFIFYKDYSKQKALSCSVTLGSTLFSYLWHCVVHLLHVNLCALRVYQFWKFGQLLTFEADRT